MLLPLGSPYRGGDPVGLVDLARRAERAGVDGVVLAEHIVMSDDVDEYEWGSFPLRPSDPFPEPLITMAAIAASTQRLTLGTGILIAALRPAALLAKQIATLDRLCGGRLELGVGTGWHRAEFQAHGLDHASRGRLLTDTMAACRVLWGAQPATVDTASFSFGPVWCEPRPVRAGGPPVLFSGKLTARNIRRIVKLGDGWIPIMGQDHDGIAAGIEKLGREYRSAGRDPSQIQVRVPLPLIRSGEQLSLEATLAAVPDAARPGITDATIPVAAFVRSAADLDPFFDGIERYMQARAG